MQTIYDFIEAIPKFFPSLIFVGAFVFCSVFIFVKYKKVSKSGKAGIAVLLKNDNVIGACLLLIFSFFMAYSFLNITDYISLKNIYRTHKTKEISGYIRHYEEKHYTKYSSISSVSYTHLKPYGIPKIIPGPKRRSLATL